VEWCTPVVVAAWEAESIDCGLGEREKVERGERRGEREEGEERERRGEREGGRGGREKRGKREKET
jgi:hypothetical protein